MMHNVTETPWNKKYPLFHPGWTEIYCVCFYEFGLSMCLCFITQSLPTHVLCRMYTYCLLHYGDVMS